MPFRFYSQSQYISTEAPAYKVDIVVCMININVCTCSAFQGDAEPDNQKS